VHWWLLFHSSLDAGAPTLSGMYPSIIFVEGHPIIKIFWVFNSLSFFYAISALLVALIVARPSNKETTIRKVMLSLQVLLILAYNQLIISVVFAIGAFISAGFVVLPPIPSYTDVTVMTFGIGMYSVVVQLTQLFVILPVVQVASVLSKRLKF